MKKPTMLAAILLPLLGGCESYTWSVYANPSLTGGEKQGQECLPHDPLGLGRKVDLTGHEAMRVGGITKVRNIEYQVTKFQGVGRECVVAYGE